MTNVPASPPIAPKIASLMNLFIKVPFFVWTDVGAISHKRRKRHTGSIPCAFWASCRYLPLSVHSDTMAHCIHFAVRAVSGDAIAPRPGTSDRLSPGTYRRTPRARNLRSHTFRRHRPTGGPGEFRTTN